MEYRDNERAPEKGRVITIDLNQRNNIHTEDANCSESVTGTQKKGAAKATPIRFLGGW